jgi:hypothetical protein
VEGFGGRSDSVVVYNGATWSTSPIPGADGNGAEFEDVSCASASFCMGIRSHQFTIYDGRAWSPWTDVANATFNRIACTSRTLCVAIENGNTARTFAGTSWSSPETIDTLSKFDVSCAYRLCVAVGTSGSAVTSRG